MTPGGARDDTCDHGFIQKGAEGKTNLVRVKLTKVKMLNCFWQSREPMSSIADHQAVRCFSSTLGTAESRSFRTCECKQFPVSTEWRGLFRHT